MALTRLAQVATADEVERRQQISISLTSLPLLATAATFKSADMYMTCGFVGKDEGGYLNYPLVCPPTQTCYVSTPYLGPSLYTAWIGCQPPSYAYDDDDAYDYIQPTSCVDLNEFENNSGDWDLQGTVQICSNSLSPYCLTFDNSDSTLFACGTSYTHMSLWDFAVTTTSLVHLQPNPITIIPAITSVPSPTETNPYPWETATATTTTSSSSQGSQYSLGGVIGTFAGLGVLFGIGICLCFKRHRRRRKLQAAAATAQSMQPHIQELLSQSLRQPQQRPRLPQPALRAPPQRAPPQRAPPQRAPTPRTPSPPPLLLSPLPSRLPLMSQYSPTETALPPPYAPSPPQPDDPPPEYQRYDTESTVTAAPRQDRNASQTTD